MEPMSRPNDHDDGEGAENRVCILLSTCAPRDAERLAGFLVEGGHAACVNIVPQVRSIYRWQGKVERDGESLLVIKCSRDRAPAVQEALVEEHPYEVPEVLILEVQGGNPSYLSWVLESSKGS